MDRFVIRTPRESPGGDGPPGSGARGGRLRQATLGSLRRVVSLVDVERLLDALAAAGVDEEEAETGGGARRERDAEMDARPVGTEERRAMDSDSVNETREAEECRRRSEEKEEEDGERRLAEALSALRHKVPSRELLVSTGLGRAVRRLRRRRGGDPAVAALAAEMYGRWRGFYEARDSLGPLRPVMVSGGPRRKTRAMLTRALAEKSDEVRLREKLEQEVFCQLGGSSFSSSSYRRTVRAVALALSHRPQLREALASGAMTPREAVSSHRKL
ncbi:unnamed protein product [Lampetra fluviatilis]